MVSVFVDVDHTLIRGNSQMRLAHYFFCKGVIDIRHLAYIVLWSMGKIFNVCLVDNLTIRQKCYSKLSGKKREVVDGLFLEFYKSRIEKIICQNAKTVIIEHQRKKHQIVLVSATIDGIVRPLAEAVGADAYFCTQLEVKNDMYTGRIVGRVVEGEAKAKLLQKWAETNHISLKESFAYGNSKEDIPMLLSVGHPVAVNPDPILTRLAIQNRWVIMRW